MVIGVGGGGTGGALPPPPVGVRCRNFGQNFGQFHTFWAILRQNLRRISYFLGNFVSEDFFFWRSPQFGQKNRLNVGENLFFFRRSPQFAQKKTIDLSGNFQVIFRAKLWCPPPNHFELLRPWGWPMIYQIKYVASNIALLQQTKR